MKNKLIKEYERYKLQWMLDNGYTLTDLINRMEECAEETYKCYDRHQSPKADFVNFEQIGFDDKTGTRYLSYEDWKKEKVK